eukprot:6467247-Amphidinium_carterae.1
MECPCTRFWNQCKWTGVHEQIYGTRTYTIVKSQALKHWAHHALSWTRRAVAVRNNYVLCVAQDNSDMDRDELFDSDSDRDELLDENTDLQEVEDTAADRPRARWTAPMPSEDATVEPSQQYLT